MICDDKEGKKTWFGGGWLGYLYGKVETYRCRTCGIVEAGGNQQDVDRGGQGLCGGRA